jgi:uncharacterized protein YggU (UPF0235/DUF167 family)
MPKRREPGSGAAGVSVAVRVRPGAGRTRVGGRYEGPHGPALIIAVGAPAVAGKATEAVRRALADALGVRAGDVTLRLGATSHDKVFTVAAPDEAGPGSARIAAPGVRPCGGRAGGSEDDGSGGVEMIERRAAALRDGAE